MITRGVSCQKYLYTCIVDLEKAFDRVLNSVGQADDEKGTIDVTVISVISL